MGIGEIETWALLNCPYTPNFATPYLVLTRYVTLAITLALYAVGLRYRELYLLLLGIGVTVNAAVNGLLKRAFVQPVPFATCGFDHVFCTDPVTMTAVACGMPAFECQDTSFFVVSLMLYAFQWHHPHIRFFHSLLLVAWMALVAYAHSFFGFNSAAQIVVGAAIGALFALLWQLLIWTWLYPYFDKILRFAPVRWLGYRDTLCRSYPPVPGDPDPLILMVTDATAV